MSNRNFNKQVTQSRKPLLAGGFLKKLKKLKKILKYYMLQILMNVMMVDYFIILVEE